MEIISTKAIIIDIKQISNKVRHFILDLNDDIDFKAGQFINLTIKNGKGEKLTRAYSIASAPKNNNKIELCIKLIPHGKTTPHIFKKKVGDEIKIKGPFGRLSLKNVEHEKIVFLGIGTGIAPLRSMICDLLEKKEQKEILLIHGSGFEENVLYKDEFHKLQEENPNFKHVIVLSRPHDEWTGRSGYLQDNLDLIDTQNSNVFLCGKIDMVNETKQKLVQRGVLKEHIFEEKY